MNLLKKLWMGTMDLFSDREEPDEPFYDPVHLAGVITAVLFSFGAVFWLLWTLLVFGGGLPRKIGPAFQVLFTDKKLSDFGWVGYPYELGVFEGFAANLMALVLTIALITGLWWILVKGRYSRGR
ncbi:MAG: hypothetical protein A3A86_03115 [Elusimicrobia bacterium RIFCSPLOWO2_01_FULL_60_11]|nr:MAG: hypothetical protein A3A86_03115 [Elusimicrobia bacterium RIFCSPLOWO2_01_FULL_60_11]